MKTTLFGITLLLFLTACNDTIPVENLTSINDIPVEEKVETEENQVMDLIAEEVFAEDILNGQKLIAEGELIDSKLSEIEILSLLQMREEEKLAQDVYLTLYEKWGQKIFKNIAGSEETHTHAVKTLLEKYKIEDPVTDDTIGVFTSLVMQNLYNTLVKQGEKSLVDALIVGATIEDLDIKDLQEFSKEIDNADILVVYDNLERGSRNHMRSFTKNISRLGEIYTPQYISQEEYDVIISSENERGGKSGEGMGGNKGTGNGKNK